MHLPEFGGDWLVAGATLIAALVGAGTGSWFASWLESRRRSEEQMLARIGSINRALFALYRYWNELLPYRQLVLDPIRGRLDAWLNANAMVAPVNSDQPIDDGSLGFLLDVHQGEKFSELMLQQDIQGIAAIGVIPTTRWSAAMNDFAR